MDRIFDDLEYDGMMDDMPSYCHHQEHQQHLQEVFKRLAESNKISRQVLFAQKTVEYQVLPLMELNKNKTKI